MQALVNDAEIGAFGEGLVYTPPTPPGGPDVELFGRYGAPPVQVQFEDTIVSSVGPSVDVRRADIPGGPLVRAIVVMRGETFEVFNVDGPNSAGMCRLTLKRIP